MRGAEVSGPFQVGLPLAPHGVSSLIHPRPVTVQIDHVKWGCYHVMEWGVDRSGSGESVRDSKGEIQSKARMFSWSGMCNCLAVIYRTSAQWPFQGESGIGPG